MKVCIRLSWQAKEKQLKRINIDDEEKLREQARRGAQNALAKQRERTRAFDEGARERRQAAGDDISMSAAQRKCLCGQQLWSNV